MGLDNIPRKYPCQTGGTAVMTFPLWWTEAPADRRAAFLVDHDEPDLAINCPSTQAAGGCPYRNAHPPQGSVLGMFGTDCWYRGQYGADLINRYLPGINGDVLYGTHEDPESGPYLTADECHNLADRIHAALSATPDSALADRRSADNPDPDDETPASVRKELEYLAWYLRWAADNTDGLTAWF